MLKGQAVKRLGKKSKKGFRGFPVETVACYGPDDRRASKVTVAIVPAKDQEPYLMRRWLSDDQDVRTDPQVITEILEFIQRSGGLTVVMADRIIGCPHEEGIDYEGGPVPNVPSGPDATAGQER
ncbi:hypothetical protein JL100_022710 [Skermanella mucosa]|uniref:hypothetical protein n=1 Tax=Skermanella mucosa TaxID=1789672 RepID=UPI00192AB0F1|nr:hypothetical protein [Skermanella mucosa]UEM19868.1 hypothetical protein JL100_022710 [Skermanella mucosa]